MSKKSANKQQEASDGGGVAANRKRPKLLGHVQQQQQQQQGAFDEAKGKKPKESCPSIQEVLGQHGKQREEILLDVKQVKKGSDRIKNEEENQPDQNEDSHDKITNNNNQKEQTDESQHQATSNHQTPRQQQQQQNICAACLKPIRERYLLMALDKHWHEDCLKCACCDCRLGEVGSSLFTHSNKLLCRRDFLRIFGRHGNCAACQRSIPPYELVMRANENAYHLDCFSCQNCHYRFCVGDRFHLTPKHKVICILCHNEDSRQPQVVSAKAASESPSIGSLVQTSASLEETAAEAV